MLGASAECRLEFAAETLAIRMAEQKTRQRARIGRNVKAFVGANPGIWTGGDVAHGISASLAGRNVGGRETPHHAGGVVDVDVMKLEILAGGDVGDAVGIFFGKLRHSFELRRVEAAGGNLYALHTGRIPQGVWAFGQIARRKS